MQVSIIHSLLESFIRQWVWRCCNWKRDIIWKALVILTFGSTWSVSVDFPKELGWVSSPKHCCRKPGTMGQSCYHFTQVIIGRAGKKPGCLLTAARALLVFIINENTSLLHIVNKSLNPSLEGGSRIALYKSGVVSSGIVYQLASNPGFSCSLFKNSVSLAAVP